jgi:hypothetical protein
MTRSSGSRSACFQPRRGEPAGSAAARAAVRVVRAARAVAPSGRGPLARAADAVANSRLAGALLEPLPALTMRSDLTDVVYVYLVPAAAALPLVPPDQAS